MTDALPYLSQGDLSDDVEATTGFVVRGDAIAQFDALLHEINPDAVRVDARRLQHLMQWLLGLPVDTAHDLLERRLCRLEQLRAMLDDPDWNTGDAIRQRLAKVLEYVDRQDDMIADREPMIGLLDDVLLLELAWPAVATEAEEYRDFCRYRDDRHPTGSGDEQRGAWVRDRFAEIALWRHRLEVRGGHYPPSDRSPALFRVI
ncbi:MAG TPA: hypothetical protein VK827_07340 [Lysobacter sp.]|nr:hypothetical protein [Lysobacter sp.]